MNSIVEYDFETYKNGLFREMICLMQEKGYTWESLVEEYEYMCDYGGVKALFEETIAEVVKDSYDQLSPAEKQQLTRAINDEYLDNQTRIMAQTTGVTKIQAWADQILCEYMKETAKVDKREKAKQNESGDYFMTEADEHQEKPKERGFFSRLFGGHKMKAETAKSHDENVARKDDDLDL